MFRPQPQQISQNIYNSITMGVFQNCMIMMVNLLQILMKDVINETINLL